MEVLIKDFIFCDDIRNEEGRKFSIMGVYTDKLKIMTKTPDSLKKIRLPLSIFIRLHRLVDTKDRDFNFEILVDFEKTNLAKIEGTVNFGEEKYSTIPIKRMEFDFDKPGILTLKMTMRDKSNRVLFKYEESLKIVIEEASKALA